MTYGETAVVTGLEEENKGSFSQDWWCYFYTKQVYRGSKTNMSNDSSLERLFMLCQKISDAEFKQLTTKEVWSKKNKLEDSRPSFVSRLKKMFLDFV